MTLRFLVAERLGVLLVRLVVPAGLLSFGWAPAGT